MNLTKIKEARKSASLTQKQVSKSLGIKEQSYRNFENGQHSLKLERLTELLDILNLKFEDIRGGANMLENLKNREIKKIDLSERFEELYENEIRKFEEEEKEEANE